MQYKHCHQNAQKHVAIKATDAANCAVMSAPSSTTLRTPASILTENTNEAREIACMIPCTRGEHVARMQHTLTTASSTQPGVECACVCVCAQQWGATMAARYLQPPQDKPAVRRLCSPVSCCSQRHQLCRHTLTTCVSRPVMPEIHADDASTYRHTQKHHTFHKQHTPSRPAA